jgi:hypothetical protein
MKNTFIIFIIFHESSSSSLNQTHVYSNLAPNIINICYVYFQSSYKHKNQNPQILNKPKQIKNEGLLGGNS